MGGTMLASPVAIENIDAPAATPIPAHSVAYTLRRWSATPLVTASYCDEPAYCCVRCCW